MKRIRGQRVVLFLELVVPYVASDDGDFNLVIHTVEERHDPNGDADRESDREANKEAATSVAADVFNGKLEEVAVFRVQMQFSSYNAVMSFIFLKTTVVMMLPLIVAGILHMAVVKWDSLSYLKIPLHPRWFGANKTWRGVFVMPALSVLGMFVARLVEASWQTSILGSHSALWLGLSLGFGYVFAELPNSYLKRRLGIRPGEISEQRPWLFSLIDQADSVVGCAVVYAIWGLGDLGLWTGLVILGTLVHLMINVGLYNLGLRKHPL